jgi:hypothetical protein
MRLTRWAAWPAYGILAIGLLTLLIQDDPAGWYILGIGACLLLLERWLRPTEATPPRETDRTD